MARRKYATETVRKNLVIPSDTAQKIKRARSEKHITSDAEVIRQAVEFFILGMDKELYYRDDEGNEVRVLCL